MTDQVEIILKNRRSAIDGFVEQLEKLAQEWQLPPGVVFDLNLVVEELVMNIVLYGYDNDSEHEIVLKLSKMTDVVTIQLIDDGVAFNPLEVPRPDIDARLENRKIGGLGIHFVRGKMDDIQYQRKHGKNILTLSKKIDQ